MKLVSAAVIVPLLGLVGCSPRANAQHYEDARHAAPDPLVWLVALLIAGFGVSIAAAVWLPSPALKKTACASAAGFLSSLVLTLCIQAIRPYMLWVALGLIVVAGLVAILHFRRELMADLVKVTVS